MKKYVCLKPAGVNFNAFGLEILLVYALKCIWKHLFSIFLHSFSHGNGKFKFTDPPSQVSQSEERIKGENQATIFESADRYERQLVQ